MKPAEHAIDKSQMIALSPTPDALVESLRSIGYTFETALADIIDNSISAGAASISVRFRWSEGKPWVSVQDDGCGMSTTDLRNAMRFGSQSPVLKRSKNDLGRFGLGLKTASISQCRQVTVYSKTGNSIAIAEWDLDFLTQSDSNEWMLKLIGNDELERDGLLSQLSSCLNEKNSGTVVIWRTLDAMLAGTERVDSERKFSELMNHARKHLETVFHRFLSPAPRQKAIHIDFNNSNLIAFNPFGPNIPARQELPLETVSVNGQSIKVQPYVLPHQNKVSRSEYEKYAGEGGYLQNQGFYVYRNNRLIVKATWFRLIKKEELNKLIRVCIDIPNSLDHIWAVNVNKSQVTPPEIVRKQLRKIIKRISGAGKQVYRRKAAKVINSNLVAVWTREISDGKINYSINLEYPLFRDLLENSGMLKGQIESALSMVAQSFPTDVFYADKANDDLDVSLGEIEEDAAADLCRQLIQTYRECGLSHSEIEKKLTITEIPGASPSTIRNLIQKELT